MLQKFTTHEVVGDNGSTWELSHVLTGLQLGFESFTGSSEWHRHSVSLVSCFLLQPSSTVEHSAQSICFIIGMFYLVATALWMGEGGTHESDIYPRETDLTSSKHSSKAAP